MHTTNFATFQKFLFVFGPFLTGLLLYACIREHKSVNATDEFPLYRLTIEDLQRQFSIGKTTSVEATRLYLDRIALMDKDGPMLNAVIELNPDALVIAAQMDAERAAGHTRGPLHGIPVLIKDNINTRDRMQTTAGSLAMEGHYAREDAPVVARLREAGAVILGKTNLTEWSNFRSGNARSGWSSRGGQTRNPYVLDLTPCGSSAGSAVAVAADLCMVSIGTSTNGSIACPASMNGVVGIRPTVGLIDSRGIIPISKTQDTPGTFGQTVFDAALLLNVLAVRQETTLHHGENDQPVYPDFTANLNKKALKDKRIGIDRKMIQDNQGIGAILQEAIRQLEEAGAVIVEVDFSEKNESMVQAERTLLEYEFKSGINAYLASEDAPMKSLEDIVAFNNENAEKVMPFFGQDLMLNAMPLGDLTSPNYLTAKKEIQTMNKYLNQLVVVNNLDAFAGIGFGAYSPPAISGWPSVTVPAGSYQEMPIGLTFFSMPYTETKLLAIAYAYEQAAPHLSPPKYIPSHKGS